VQDDINAVARGLLPTRVSNAAPMYTLPLVSNLWSVALYGLNKVNPFLECPMYGKCRKASKRERKENQPDVCGKHWILK
jgi:hypothetical protein